MPMSAIEARRLTYHTEPGWFAKSRILLDDLNVSVETGGIFALVGKNGAGKTTLIKACLGLLRPHAGSVQIYGHRAGSPPALRCIGFMPERPYFPMQLKATDILLTHGMLAGHTYRAAARKMRQCLGEVGLGDDMHRPLRAFSKGMLQRAALAQALIGDPALLILDEPMSGLDPTGRMAVRDMMTRLKDAGKTLVFATHVLADVEAIAQTVAILDGGRLVRVLTGSDIRQMHDGIYEVLASPPAQQTTMQAITQMPVVLATYQHPTAVALRVKAVDGVNTLVDALRRRGCSIIAVRLVQTPLETWFSRPDSVMEKSP